MSVYPKVIRWISVLCWLHKNLICRLLTYLVMICNSTVIEICDDIIQLSNDFEDCHRTDLFHYLTICISKRLSKFIFLRKFFARLRSGYYGYQLNLFALAESVGFAVLISPLLIFIKKIADTTYSGPPFILFLRYHGIS